MQRLGPVGFPERMGITQNIRAVRQRIGVGQPTLHIPLLGLAGNQQGGGTLVCVEASKRTPLRTMSSWATISSTINPLHIMQKHHQDQLSGLHHIGTLLACLVASTTITLVGRGEQYVGRGFSAPKACGRPVSLGGTRPLFCLRWPSPDDATLLHRLSQTGCATGSAMIVSHAMTSLNLRYNNGLLTATRINSLSFSQLSPCNGPASAVPLW